MYRGIKKGLTIAGITLGIWVSIQILLPLCLPFLLGGAIALAAEPMVSFLCSSWKLRRGAGAAIGVTAAFCLLILLFLLLMALILREITFLMGVLPNLEEAVDGGLTALSGWALNLAGRLPGGLGDWASRSVSDFFSGGSRLLEQAFRFALGLTGGILSQVPDGALIFGTAVISSYMISVRLPRIRRWLREKISGERIQKILGSLRRVKSALFGWLKAQIKLMGITWLILTMGLVLLRIRYAPLWAAAVALVDAFPILGTGTVLLPWSLVCALQGDTARAVGLLGVYGIISLTRSVMEPKLLGDNMGLDPLVTLLALYAGYRLWGFGGMIIAPVLAVTAVQLTKEPNR